MEIQSEDVSSIYTYDFRRDIYSQLRSTDENVAYHPVWTPDGEWIYYAVRATNGEFHIFRGPADRSALPASFLQRPGFLVPHQFTPDGRHLLFEENATQENHGDIFYLAVDDGEPQALVATPGDEGHVALSPDGRWVAYVSNVSGRDEVYVTPFPGPGRTIQVSNQGGDMPRWAKDGSRLYFAWTPGLLREAVVVPGSDLDFEAPRELVRQGVPGPRIGTGTSYDTARDGRLIMADSGAGIGPTGERPTLVVVLNWFDVVRERAPRR